MKRTTLAILVTCGIIATCSLPAASQDLAATYKGKVRHVSRRGW